MNELILKLCTMTGCSEKQAENFIKDIVINPVASTRLVALDDLLDFISGHSGE